MKPIINIESPNSFNLVRPCDDKPLSVISLAEQLNHMKTCPQCRDDFHWLLKKAA